MLEVDSTLTQIYDSIEDYKALHGYSPTQDELAHSLGITKAQVARMMDEMEELRMIVQPRGLLKAIKLLSRQPNVHNDMTHSAHIAEFDA